MKRTVLLFAALALVLATSAQAQLTMQMGNGWSFTFAGNVNAFLTYESVSNSGATNAPTNFYTPPGGISGLLVPDSTRRFKESRIRTGLLPAFAVFQAKGKEGNTDLGVTFGFAPQINCASGQHDCFGAQIDMRQVFLTVGGSWGQILAGRELGLFSRQNILNDQTLFGVGGTGSGGPGSAGSGGTTLGRIGYGYVYPQFKAQMTYSSPGGRPSQFSVGLFEAAVNGNYSSTEIPRIEGEFTHSAKHWKGWVGGLLQTNKDGYSGTTKSAASVGVDGGLRWMGSSFSLTGSGYYGKGIGTTLLFNLGTNSAGVADSGSRDLTKSYGFIGQGTYTSGKITVAASYGSSYLKDSETGNTANAPAKFKIENSLFSGGVYYQATKSLKVVVEGNYATSKLHASGLPAGSPALPKKNSSFAPAFGLMLFF